MSFWKMVYDMVWIDIDTLRKAVITDGNPFGDITKEEFKEISGEDYE